jgi:FkbM family methyltransferase
MTFKNLGTGIDRVVLRLFAGSGLRKIWIIEKINLLVRTSLKPKFIITKRYGHKMFLDKIDSLYLSVHKDWENVETKLIEESVKKGGIVLDIGANIGFYTLVMARLVGEKGRVYAFEADPTNFEILKKNVEVNGYQNVTLVNRAVLDKRGKIKLYVDKGNTAGNSLFKGKSKKYREVEAIKLDDYFKKNKKIDFVKLDIEGSEGRAMKGMSKILDVNKNIKLVTEFYPRFLEGVGKEINFGARDYLEFLIKKKFNLYYIDEKNSSLTLLSPKEILDKAGKMWVNLFCKRG